MDRKDKLISEMRSSFHPQFTLHSLQRISERLCIEVTRIVDTDIDGRIIRWPVKANWIPPQLITNILDDIDSSIDMIYASPTRDWFILLWELALYIFSMQWELMTVCNADTNWLFTLYNNEYEFLDLYKAHKLMTSIQY